MTKKYCVSYASDIPEIFDACNITVSAMEIFGQTPEDDKRYLDIVNDRIENIILNMPQEIYDEMNKGYEFFDRDACASWLYHMFLGGHTVDPITCEEE